MTDEELRQRWREAGGAIDDRGVLTPGRGAGMPEAQLLLYLRGLYDRIDELQDEVRMLEGGP